MSTSSSFAENIKCLIAAIPELPRWGTLHEALRVFDAVPEPQDITDAESVISQLERLCPSERISTIEGYRDARVLASVTTGVWCSVFNRNLGDAVFQRIDDLLNRVHQKLLSFTRTQKTKDPEVALISRYAVWNRRFPDADHRSILVWLHEKGVLRKQVGRHGSARFFVTGLSAKVGDNVFAIDHRERRHRQYVHVVSMQAFPVSFSEKSLRCLWDGDTPRSEPLPQSFIDNVPDLDESLFTTTYFGNGKGLARYLPVRQGAAWSTLSRLGFC